jgi:hypothetical protein
VCQCSTAVLLSQLLGCITAGLAVAVVGQVGDGALQGGSQVESSIGVEGEKDEAEGGSMDSRSGPGVACRSRDMLSVSQPWSSVSAGSGWAAAWKGVNTAVSRAAATDAV